MNKCRKNKYQFSDLLKNQRFTFKHIYNTAPFTIFSIFVSY
jgi:hypothetical protein